VKPNSINPITAVKLSASTQRVSRKRGRQIARGLSASKKASKQTHEVKETNAMDNGDVNEKKIEEVFLRIERWSFRAVLGLMFLMHLAVVLIAEIDTLKGHVGGGRTPAPESINAMRGQPPGFFDLNIPEGEPALGGFEKTNLPSLGDIAPTPRSPGLAIVGQAGE
jgi:hypothetical protein